MRALRLPVIVLRALGYDARMTPRSNRRITHRFRQRWAVVVLTALSARAVAAGAQVARGDTTVAAPKPARAAPRGATRLSPPLTPRRAFLSSLVLPGYGQSRLDRGTSGALFASVELAAIAMVRRSRADLLEVRRYRIDTLASDFVVSGTQLTKTGIFTNRYSSDLEKTRQLHVEDWLAAVAFNHLFAGADAFVAAQLWDIPISLSATPRAGGTLLAATIRW